MVAVPNAGAATIPVALPIEATDVLLLLHAPPAVALEKVVATPAHKLVVPVIAVDNPLIVTVALPSAPQHPAADNALK